MNTAFHLAIGVNDLQKARDFYIQLLGAKEGRSADSWVDFNWFGHQLSCHLITNKAKVEYRLVDQKAVPIPHFGLIVALPEFKKIQTRLEQINSSFVIKTYTRFKGLKGEHKTLFFKDPFENCIEIKSFSDPDKVFDKTE